jgi:hypothetical protein
MFATHYRPKTTQTVSYTGTSAASTNPFGAGITVVRVICTTDAHIVFAGTPVATTGAPLIPAFTPEYFSVSPGEKIAAIQNLAAGTLYVTEMTQ